MSKISKLFTWCVLLPFCLQAGNYFVSLKPGYFHFADNTMRDIYRDGGFAIQGEAGAYLCPSLTGSIAYQHFAKNGKAVIVGPDVGAFNDSELFKDRNTRIRTHTVTFFVKGFLPCFECIAPYIGVGPRLFIANVRNSCMGRKSTINKSRIGAAVAAGLFYKIPCTCLFLDAFFDFGFCNIDTRSSVCSASCRRFLNGATAGGGLGYCF